ERSRFRCRDDESNPLRVHAYMMSQQHSRNPIEHRRRGSSATHRMRFSAAMLLLMMSTTACEQILPQRADMALPDSATIHTYYVRHGLQADYRYSGNVLE